MSAFLGPIHKWLFRKIEIQEELVRVIVKIGEEEYGISDLNQLVDNKFGTLETGQLEDIIDGKNIHGWLQQRISLVERRLAFATVTVLEDDPARINKICEKIRDYGKTISVNSDKSLKEAYVFLEDLLLNGMPCDRINQITCETEEEISWEQTVDIHEEYWKSLGGEVKYYYLIRESLINGTLYSSPYEFYKKTENEYVLKNRRNKMVTKDMILGDLLRENANAAEVLMSCGMHCLGCPSAQMESIEDACAVHGLDVEEVLAKLNA